MISIISRLSIDTTQYTGYTKLYATQRHDAGRVAIHNRRIGGMVTFNTTSYRAIPQSNNQNSAIHTHPDGRFRRSYSSFATERIKGQNYSTLENAKAGQGFVQGTVGYGY